MFSSKRPGVGRLIILKDKSQVEIVKAEEEKGIFFFFVFRASPSSVLHDLVSAKEGNYVTRSKTSSK